MPWIRRLLRQRYSHALCTRAAIRPHLFSLPPEGKGYALAEIGAVGARHVVARIDTSPLQPTFCAADLPSAGLQLRLTRVGLAALPRQELPLRRVPARLRLRVRDRGDGDARAAQGQSAPAPAAPHPRRRAAQRDGLPERRCRKGAAAAGASWAGRARAGKHRGPGRRRHRSVHRPACRTWWMDSS